MKNCLPRLRQFIENEMRSFSMDLAGITPEYVQRMWGGTVSLEDIEKALAVLKAAPVGQQALSRPGRA